jgi:WD repeat-containing protein 61
LTPSTNIGISILAEYEGHIGSVFAMTIDQEEKYLYTSGDDGVVARWDLEQKGGDATGILKSGRAIYALEVSDEENVLVAGSSDGTLYFYDLEKKELIRTIRKTSESIFCLKIVEGKVWVCQGGGFLSAYDLRQDKEYFFGRICEENLRVMVPAMEEGQFYIGASDHSIYLIDLNRGKVLGKWAAHENSVFSLLMHPTSKYLLSGSRDAHYFVWDLKQEKELIKKVPAHNFTINDFALSMDENYFVTASRDKTIKIWDAYDFKLLKVIDRQRHQGHSHSVNKIIWLKRDNSVISCSDDRRIIRWGFDFQEVKS